MQKVPIIALPSTSLYYVLKTVPLQRLLYQDYLDLHSTVHHKSHLLIYLYAIALPLCSTTYNRCTELWDADSSPSEGPIHPNLAFLCIPMSVGLDCLHFLVFSIRCIPGAILDMALEGCLGIADGSQPHRSILYGREGARALNIGDLSWASWQGSLDFASFSSGDKQNISVLAQMVPGTCASHSIPNFILLSPLHGLSMTVT